MRWEYMTLCWCRTGILIWPADKFDVEWFKAEFPKAKAENPVVNIGFSSPQVPKAWKLRDGSGCEGYAAAHVISHLGAQGWEVVRIEGRILENIDQTESGHGEAWLRRPLPE